MNYIGDYAEDYATLNVKFPTTAADGTPTTLAGTPVVKVYKGSATGTESTAGITLTVDFDSVTGLNNVLIDLSADAFYATGQDYSIVITTGTVDSVSVVGAVVALFSIENRFGATIIDDWTNGGRLDLLLDAVKEATDKLTFTVANKVDSNVQSVNDVTVTGVGTSGDPWGP